MSQKPTCQTVVLVVGAGPTGLLAIRPDGYIGLRPDRGDRAALERYDGFIRAGHS